MLYLQLCVCDLLLEQEGVYGGTVNARPLERHDSFKMPFGRRFETIKSWVVQWGAYRLLSE